MADIRVSDVKQMTPGRAALREIAERLKTGDGLYQSIMSVPSPRWYEDVQQIADYVLAIAAPLLVTCGECGGSGRKMTRIPIGADDCPTCNGTGKVEREDLAAIRKRFEDAPHDMTCANLAGRCETCGYVALSHNQDAYYGFVARTCGAFIAQPCNCWKATFGLDALLDLIAAQAREIERLKGHAPMFASERQPQTALHALGWRCEHLPVEPDGICRKCASGRSPELKEKANG